MAYNTAIANECGYGVIFGSMPDGRDVVMTQVSTTLDRGRGLTTVTLTGALGIQELLLILRQVYESDVTPLILWDLSAADLSDVTPAQIEKIAHVAKQFGHLRAGGRGAFVTRDDLNFGLARMLEIYADLQQYPIALAVFKTTADALNWLESSTKGE